LNIVDINVLKREHVTIFMLSEVSYKSTDCLDYNTTDVVGISPKPPYATLGLVPDRRILFHQHAWISNYGDHLPPIKLALMVDISVLPSERMDVDALRTKQYVG
jgi:hypothetical protein